MVRFSSSSSIISRAAPGSAARAALTSSRCAGGCLRFRCTQMHALGDLFDRQRRFFSQPRRYRQPGSITFAARLQLALTPAKPAQLLGNKTLGLGHCGFTPQFTAVMLAQFPLHLLEHLLPKLISTHAPTAPKNPWSFLVLFRAPGLDASFKFLPACRRIV